RKEMSDRTPYIVEVVQRVASRSQPARGELRIQPSRFSGELARQAGGNLHVAREAGVFRDRRERFARLGGVAHGVVAVGGVEEVNVASAGVVTLVDDLA